jgi:hypothetical protein
MLHQPAQSAAISFITASRTPDVSALRRRRHAGVRLTFMFPAV